MCAVVGLIDIEHHDVERRTPLCVDAYRALTALQHRGQDASGMAALDGQVIRVHKGSGLVRDVYADGCLDGVRGGVLVGHNRYTTVGSHGEGDIQPMLSGRTPKMALAHNGNVLNILELKDRMRRQEGAVFHTHSDLECFLHVYGSSDLEAGWDGLVGASKRIVEIVNGSYALVGFVEGFGLFGLRDPHGIRPLVLGKKDGRYCLASETGGLDFADFAFVRDIEPGELVLVDFGGRIHSSILKEDTRAHCMFEWVYFAGAESFVEKKSVYEGRLALGRKLGGQVKALMEEGSLAPDLVAPVPDTSRTAAMALGEVVGVPYRECLIKNRYVQRSFILGSQEQRDREVHRKLIPIRSEIEGKNILLVDDSIVRGTTSKQIVRLLKKYGVGKVYLAFTCPPIKYSCFYGIDFPSVSELIAHGRRDDADSLDDMGLGADRVVYLSLDNLEEALLKGKMCTGCLTNRYPTNVEQGKLFAQHRDRQRGRE